jgi:putative nucleotidyltransferase with HDIG domain
MEKYSPERPTAPTAFSRKKELLPELPDLDFPEADMELFDPDVYPPDESASRDDAGDPGGNRLPLARAARRYPHRTFIPGEEDCRLLWDRYAMLSHIREHSMKVADFAYALALRAAGLGMKVNPDAVRAAGLLHDLGKTRTIAEGGNHAQLGAAWVMRETRNGPIARAVLFHVFWPFERGNDDGRFMIAAVIYADKRTLHDAYVGLDTRCEDLISRYAVNDDVKKRILFSHEQGRRIEASLSTSLGLTLEDYVARNGRLLRSG